MIPNFSLVDPGIYRGGQPDEDGWNMLRDIGVKHIIKLNEDSNGVDPHDTFDLFKVPIPPSQHIFTEPDLDQVLSASGFIGPYTFVHCTHGEDRTGLVVGAYRLRQGWTKDQAFEEMLRNGFHVILVGLMKAWEDLEWPK